MRKALLLVTSLVCAAALAVVTAPASATTTSNLEAAFQYHYGHAAEIPAAPASRARSAGYGSATATCSVTSLTPIPGTSCANATYDATIELADGSSLSLHASGTVCPVGNSGNAPGSLVSYGNPISLHGTFTIAGGTGVFAGASGEGSFLDYFAGDVQVVQLNGTLALA